MADSLEQELASVLNRHSAENASDTPDFILAQYLIACLAAFNDAAHRRETWYGRELSTKVSTGRARQETDRD